MIRGLQHPRPAAGHASPCRWPRILLFGAEGQLGRELQRALAPLGQVIPVRRFLGPASPQASAAVDFLELARQPGLADDLLRNYSPSLLVNAAAYTAVDRAEQEPEQAMAVNHLAVAALAAAARRRGAGLVHYSTDYVFDGAGRRGWREHDPAGPLNVYGRSKWAGEQAIRAAGAAHLIIRTSWLYGAGRDNFVTTILRLAAQRETVSVVSDQFGSPTSAAVVAGVTARLLTAPQQDFASYLRQHGGTVHVCCRGAASRFRYAGEIVRQARRLGMPLSIRRLQPIIAEEFPCPAARPLNSRLDTTLLRERFGITPPTWRAALRAFLASMTFHELADAPPAEALRSAPLPPVSAVHSQRCGFEKGTT